ncbi:MAG: type I methionyl aminopeptidase [Chloroflexota bacterium]|nr:type I methionyl aminopeptidase [Chloroflexota bacterium]
MAIVIKSAGELAVMRKAGRVVAVTLAALARQVRPGMTTLELDRLAEFTIRAQGATPSFKGYRGFPASVCVSVNEEVVHGIPGKRVLREGEIVSLDVGAIFEGMQGDAALTVPVGQVSTRMQTLMRVTQVALAAGIQEARVGNRLGDISAAIQKVAEGAGFSVVREYGGHGVGRSMHEDPHIPNWGQPGTGILLKAGMTLALEPMVNVGKYQVRVKSDNWTVVTVDGQPSAHFEHTVAITEGEPEILTVE